jgi:hypothetical protein
MTLDARGSDRALVYVAAGIVGLVAITAAVVLVLGGREPTSFPADSPAGVVQRHLAAFEDGDLEAAHAFFSSEVRSEMDVDAYEQVAREYGMYPDDISRRVLFDRTDAEADRATVHLTVEEYYGGGPLGGGETYRSSRQVRLVREDGTWHIDEPIVGIEPAPFPFEPIGP